MLREISRELSQHNACLHVATYCQSKWGILCLKHAVEILFMWPGNMTQSATNQWPTAQQPGSPATPALSGSTSFLSLPSLAPGVGQHSRSYPSVRSASWLDGRKKSRGSSSSFSPPQSFSHICHPLLSWTSPSHTAPPHPAIKFSLQLPSLSTASLAKLAHHPCWSRHTLLFGPAANGHLLPSCHSNQQRS